MSTVDIVVIAVIAAIVSLAVYKIVKDKKNGVKCTGCSECNLCPTDVQNAVTGKAANKKSDKHSRLAPAAGSK